MSIEGNLKTCKAIAAGPTRAPQAASKTTKNAEILPLLIALRTAAVRILPAVAPASATLVQSGSAVTTAVSAFARRSKIPKHRANPTTSHDRTIGTKLPPVAEPPTPENIIATAPKNKRIYNPTSPCSTRCRLIRFIVLQGFPLPPKSFLISKSGSYRTGDVISDSRSVINANSVKIGVVWMRDIGSIFSNKVFT